MQPSQPEGPRLGLIVAGLFVSVAAAACTGAGGSAPVSSSPSPIAAVSPTPSAPPSGEGVVGGPVVPGRPIGIDEGPPDVPKPGQRDVQPVKLTSLGTRVEGFHVIVIARWTSGVEPCTVLDSVVLKKAAGSIEVTVREGTSDPGAVCNMLAKLKWIGVDVGELNGVWTISDTEGGAKPIEFGGP